MTTRKRRTSVEFGGSQTSDHLARAVCDVVLARGLSPASIVEPTCGQGSFLAAAIDIFPAATVRGYARNPE